MVSVNETAREVEAKRDCESIFNSHQFPEELWEDHKFLKAPFDSHFRLIRFSGDQTDINSEGMKFLWEFL